MSAVAGRRTAIQLRRVAPRVAALRWCNVPAGAVFSVGRCKRGREDDLDLADIGSETDAAHTLQGTQHHGRICPKTGILIVRVQNIDGYMSRRRRNGLDAEPILNDLHLSKLKASILLSCTSR
jgi:hypothetical protein